MRPQDPRAPQLLGHMLPAQRGLGFPEPHQPCNLAPTLTPATLYVEWPDPAHAHPACANWMPHHGWD